MQQCYKCSLSVKLICGILTEPNIKFKPTISLLLYFVRNRFQVLWRSGRPENRFTQSKFHTHWGERFYIMQQ